jgi:YD repeat-containing protein
MNSHSANYYYDDAARVVKLTDWIDGTNGIQYEYDDLGRLETVRDYDVDEEGALRG